MYRSSSNVDPTQLPWPAMFSMTIMTVDVALIRRLMQLAMFSMETYEEHSPTVDPGLPYS
jgi:hypothetical protein